MLWRVRGRPPLRGKAARQGEHVCQTPLSTRAPWHSTRHWGYITVENVHFCTCYIFAVVHSGTMHSDLIGRDRGPFTLMHFPRLVARQKDGSQPKVKKWTKMPFLFSFFVYMCCIVKSNHASLIAVHWQMPYSAFKFLFFPPPPSLPYPQLASVFPVQANWCFLLLGVECWASFNQSHFRHFYAVFY